MKNSVISDSINYTNTTNLIVSGGKDNSDENNIKIYNWFTGRLIYSLYVNNIGRITTLAISEDGTKIVSSHYIENTIKIWDLAKGILLKILYGHTNTITNIALSKGDKYIISGSLDKSVSIWDF